MTEVTARRILVGIDASEPSRAALRWAVGEAQPGDCVEVVHSWNLHAIAGLEAPNLNSATFEVDATRLLHEAVDQVVDIENAPFDVEFSPVHGHASEVLIERSSDADLLVVGRRGLGGFKQMLLGSVSRDVVQHAACPVVVVPAP